MIRLRSASRIWWIKLVTVAGLLAGLLLSLPLWTGTEFFPTVPWVSWWVFPGWVDTIVLLSVCASALYAVVTSRPRVGLLVSVIGLLLLVSVDQMRFQPWVYQYGFMVAVLSTFSWRFRDVVGQETVLNTLRIMLAGIYFYSGLQKFNPIFMEGMFPKITQSIVPEYWLPVLPIFAFLVSIIEMAIGVGLLFRKTRKLALLGVLAMLGFVLLTLGPFGNNWNAVVWPWNIAFASFAFLLFYRTDTVTLRTIFSSWKSKTFGVSVLLFLLLPALFFVHLWDSYPSFSLYSGNPARSQIEIESPDMLPAWLQEYVHVESDRTVIYPLEVAVGTVGVPVYPEERVFQEVGAWFCQNTTEPERMTVVVVPRLFWVSDQADLRYSCSELE